MTMWILLVWFTRIAITTGHDVDLFGTTTSDVVQQHENIASRLQQQRQEQVILPLVGTVETTPPNCTEWTAHNRLECWLWQLKIPIPKESFSADWITISIEDMVCTQFVIQDIQPEYDPSFLHSIQLSIHQIIATCHGKYGASGGISGNVQASITSETSTLPAVIVAFRLLPSTNYALSRPFTFQTTSCQTHLKATDIHFGGSASAKLIQAFSKTIGHYITQALQEEVCPLLPKSLDPLVTDYLHQLDRWMTPYLPTTKWTLQQQEQGPPDTQVSEPNDDVGISIAMSPKSQQKGIPENNDWKISRRRSMRAISPEEDWSSSSIWIPSSQHSSRSDMVNFGNDTISMNPVDWKSVRWTLDAVNTELSSHLQSPWIIPANAAQKYCPAQQQCQDLLRGISGMFRSIVGTAFSIPLPRYFHNISLPAIPAPLDATISFGLDRISITGLDQLNALEFFRPSSSRSLVTRAATNNVLLIKAPMSLQVQMPKVQHPLEESFVFTINITSLETMMETNIQVFNWDNVTLLQLVDAIQRFSEDPQPSNIRPTLGCLIRTILSVGNHDWWLAMLLKSISISRSPERLQRLDSDSEYQSSHPSNDTATSSLEDDLDHVINTVLELLLREYADLWTDLIKGLMEDPVKHSLNNFLSEWIKHYATPDPYCPVVPPSSKPRFLNFTKFLLLDHFNDFLNHQSTIHTMNLFLKCSGQLLEGYVSAQQSSHDKGLLLQVTGVETRKWNAIRLVRLLQPIDDTTLESLLQWGSNTTVPELQINLEVNVGNISGSVNVTLFAGFQGQVRTQIAYDLMRLENLTVARLLQQVQCAMIPARGIDLLPGMTSADLGPLVGMNISALLNNQAIFYSTMEDPLGDTSSSGSTLAKEAAVVMEWAVEWIRDLANQALDSWVDRSTDLCPGIISESPSPDTPDDDEDSFLWYSYPPIWILITLVVLAQGGLFHVVIGSQISAAEEELVSNADDLFLNPSPLENDIDEHASTIRDMDESLLIDIRSRNESVENIQTSLTLEDAALFTAEGSSFREAQGHIQSLFMTPKIPNWVRFIIPISILGTIALLFSSNLSVGATVNLYLRAGNQLVPIPGLFQFSLGNTIVELYGAGIYPLLFLVTVFSGIWPYAKLIWMFYLWNTTTYSNPQQRERQLLTLDALSKFSLVDTYVLVVMMVAFRFHLHISDGLDLDVFVIPEYGFYAFLVATCLSLVIGHGMLYFHRRVDTHSHEDDEGEEDDMESEGRLCLLSYMFVESEEEHQQREEEQEAEDEQQQPRSKRSRFLMVLQGLIATCACIVALYCLLMGMSHESFSFHIGGLAGMALGKEDQVREYSVISLGWAIAESVPSSSLTTNHGRAVVGLQIAYFSYAIVTPVACLVLILTLLVIPVPLPVQRTLLVMTEMTHAWSAIEVFVLSIVTALFQLSTFASFILGDRCRVVNEVMAVLRDHGIFLSSLHGDDSHDPNGPQACFSVTAQVDLYHHDGIDHETGTGSQDGSWAKYLMVGVLLKALVTYWVLPLAQACVSDRTLSCRRLHRRRDGSEGSGSGRRLPQRRRQQRRNRDNEEESENESRLPLLEPQSISSDGQVIVDTKQQQEKGDENDRNDDDNQNDDDGLNEEEEEEANPPPDCKFWF